MTDKLYIVNYRIHGVEPMRSITRLPREEAMRVADELYAACRCYAHRRFGPDFPDYFAHRLKVEKWLYESFITLGGEPENEHPLYFVLVRSRAMMDSFEHGDELMIPLADIDSRHISFTYGDSVGMFDSPKRKPVFTLRQLYDDITRAGGVEALLESVEDDYRCIEAQLWRDSYADKQCSNIAP